MIKKYTVLLIDDDIDFCELLGEYLEREGFETLAAHDGISGYEAALDPNVNIIILDVMLPKMNGFEVLKKLKVNTATPVLMLTAKGDEADQLTGLNIGADDYLPKPCSPKLLVARLRAILRRVEPIVTETPEQLTVGNIYLDLATRATTIAGQLIELTNSEYNILCCLMKDVGKIVPKEDLSEQGLNRKIAAFDRSVDMHISHLRSKLDQAGHDSPRIRTIRGIGYILEK
ncbi:MAG: response regulator transcription factor [Gammaproteobacteria bacterium]|nr:response regulator transcription factor [Gammaproteobacteria bacterium]